MQNLPYFEIQNHLHERFRKEKVWSQKTETSTKKFKLKVRAKIIDEVKFCSTQQLKTGTGTGAVQKGIPNFLKKIKKWTYLRMFVQY